MTHSPFTSRHFDDGSGAFTGCPDGGALRLSRSVPWLLILLLLAVLPVFGQSNQATQEVNAEAYKLQPQTRFSFPFAKTP
jgi:hypothetical protein